MTCARAASSRLPLVALSVALLAGCSSGPAATAPDGSGTSPPTAATQPAAVPGDAQPARVVRIVDGDTLHLRARAPGRVLRTTRETDVRLLEVDTPETVRPDTPVECYGPEATRFLDTLLPPGSAVWVARDRELTDRYGRTLLYAWTAAGLFVNRRIVATGHGVAVYFPPNDRYLDSIEAAQSAARRMGLGLWGACPR